jgi:hypothetical protein
MLAPIKMMSASGGGQSGSVTFDNAGSYNWVAPIGVTSVKITGRGGSKETYYTWSSVSNVSFGATIGLTIYGTVTSSTLSWSTVKAGEATAISNVNSIPLSPDYQYYASLKVEANYYYKTDGSGWIASSLSNLSPGSYRRTGTFVGNASLASKTGDVPQSSVSFRPSGGSIERRVTNYNYGTDSSALGNTFPDNSAAVTYEDVAVSPLQSYSIVVGTDRGGSASFVTIEWE